MSHIYINIYEMRRNLIYSTFY